VTEPTPLAELLGAQVRTAGTRVGVVDDVYVDAAGQHVVGLEVVGPNDRRWFLPWAAANPDDGEVAAASPLVFVPLDQVEFYVEHGTRLERRDAEGMVVDATGVLSRRAAKVDPATEKNVA
jgi:sporulation protein YlmC with PRC-barrel domain